MKITLHDGRTIPEPTEADIELHFAGLSDAGDFIILNDEHRGEIRAAGPPDGTFLLQCDLPRSGRTFAGERSDVELAEAIAIFREFRAGRVHWSTQFEDRDAPPPRIVMVILILVAGGAFLLWWFSSAA